MLEEGSARLIDQAAASVSGLEAEEEEEEGAGGRRLAPVGSGGEELRVSTLWPLDVATFQSTSPLWA